MVNVPNTTAAWPIVPSCTPQSGGKGPLYTVSHEVACTPVSGAANQAKNVESCTVDADYTCRYVWETTRRIWDRTSGNCLTYQGGRNANGSVWTHPGKICYFGQNTPWTPVPSCTPGTVNGTTTQCRDNPVIEAGTDRNGWKDVDSCTQTPAGQYDADGKRVNCQRKYLGYNNKVSSCTPTTTGKEQYDCEWYGTTAETEVGACSPKGGNIRGTWIAPRETCTPVA